jgi:hypothetical protein
LVYYNLLKAESLLLVLIIIIVIIINRNFTGGEPLWRGAYHYYLQAGSLTKAGSLIKAGSLLLLLLIKGGEPTIET